MNLLALRKLIANLLTTRIRGVCNEDISGVEYLNPADGGLTWSLRVTADDGTGGTRTFRIDITEE